MKGDPVDVVFRVRGSSQAAEAIARAAGFHLFSVTRGGRVISVSHGVEREIRRLSDLDAFGFNCRIPRAGEPSLIRPLEDTATFLEMHRAVLAELRRAGASEMEIDIGFRVSCPGFPALPWSTTVGADVLQRIASAAVNVRLSMY